MTTDNFCFYLQNRLIQTSQAGGPPFSIPWLMVPREKGFITLTSGKSDRHQSGLPTFASLRHQHSVPGRQNLFMASFFKVSLHVQCHISVTKVN